MKICFSDFWSPFDPNNNFFIHLLKQSFEDVEVVHPEDADVMFFSVFGMENNLYKNCKKIFFTGENQRPNFKKCDYSLTFDFDDYEGKNFRLPLWYLYVDWFNVKIVSPTPWQKYLQAKDTLSVITNIFSVSHWVYLVFIIFFAGALILNIFVEFKKQHPHIILQTIGLLGLLACLFIM